MYLYYFIINYYTGFQPIKANTRVTNDSKTRLDCTYNTDYNLKVTFQQVTSGQHSKLGGDRDSTLLLSWDYKIFQTERTVQSVADINRFTISTSGLAIKSELMVL